MRAGRPQAEPKVLGRWREIDLYGSLRKEARPDAVSTLEAAALALSALEADPTVRERLLAPFRSMLAKARAAGVRPVKWDRRTRRSHSKPAHARPTG